MLHSMCQEDADSNTKRKFESKHVEINVKEEPAEYHNSDDRCTVSKEDTDVEYKVEIIPPSPPPELQIKTCLEEPSLLCEDQAGHEEETKFSSLDRKFGVKYSGEISNASDTTGLNIDTNESFTSYCNKVLSLQTSLDTHEQHMEINIKEESPEYHNSDDKFTVKKQEDIDVEYKVEIISQNPSPELHIKTYQEEPSLLCEDQASCEEETNFSSLDRKFGVKNSREISNASDTSGLNIDTNESFTSYCNKVLSLQTSLDTHEQVSKSTLFENIFKDTSKNRQLSCGVCNKAFFRKDHLVNHMRMHTGQKPYFCEICKKAFSLKSSLYTHERIHTGQRPYICEHCKKTFSHKHNLKVHLSTHTGQRPYICEICNKSFSYRSTLKKHNMRVHVRLSP